MITKPQDGDLGLLRGERLVRAEGGIWWHTDGSGRSQTYITPTGERAAPIEWHDDVEAVAAEMREAIAEWGDYGPPNEADIRQWADRIDLPTEGGDR